MLQNLHVKNLALIDECEVEFSDGLNILSGETGAGKSIIIGSINLALGEKVQKEMLRDNEKPAFVELIFSVEDPKIIEALRELDVEVEDGCVILSRKITQSRAVGRVNGEAVSVSRMKEIASYLIDIHGQHEHQSLLSKKKHLDILDEYAKQPLGDKKQQLSVTYKAYRALKDEYEKSNIDNEERSRELSFLEYEVKEIEEASLVSGEDEELEAQFRKFLDLNPGFDIAYIVKNLDNMDDSELIQSLSQYKNSTLYVVADPVNIEKSKEISSEQIEALIKRLKKIFSYIIIDVSTSIDAKSIKALDISDVILLIAIVNLPAIRNLQRCKNLFEKLGYSAEKIKLVLNRYMENEEIKTSDIEDVVKQKVYWKIPNNYLTMMSAVNKGEPVSRINPDSNIAVNYKEFASKLCDYLITSRLQNK